MDVTKLVIKKGDGATFPKKGQIVGVHYTGMLPDGKNFDSSRDRNSVFKFKIGANEVMKGIEEGVKGMSLGERAKLKCPSETCYGKKGFPGVIPPNQDLEFDIELLALE